MSYRPTSIYTDCGSGYGVAMVRDGDGDPVRASVDLNLTDGTATPRIQVNGNWIDVDQSFVTAYTALTSSRALSGTDRETACRAINGDRAPASEGPVDPGIARVHPFWLLSAPTLGAGGSVFVNYLAYPDLTTASRDPAFPGTLMSLLSIGSKSLYAGTFTPLTRHSDPEWAYTLSGIHAGGGLVLLAVGLTSENGRGTPWLGSSVDFMTNGGLGFCYGDRVSGRAPARFGTCAALQGGLGAAYLIMGLAGVGARSSVPESDTYAPSGMAGARDVPGNPFEANPFPGMNYQLRDSGIAQLLGMGVNVVDYLWISRAGENIPADANRPTVRVSPMTPPGGGFGLSATGTF
ncbi:MAG TPA: hypothetical protein VFX30_00010 [bacterium]|nr:hypothetical protein [bacterium]